MNLSQMTLTIDSEVVKNLKPVSTIEFILTNGSVLKVPSVLSPEDFVRLWNKPLNRTVKICSGGSSYTFIRKKQITSFSVAPVA